MTNTNTTAAQPLDLDKLPRYYMGSMDMQQDPSGKYVRIDDVAALIAQARTARPEDAAAAILPGEKWSKGNDSEGNENRDELACAGINIDTEDFPHQNAVEFYAQTLSTAQARRDAVLAAIQRAARLDTTASASIDTPTDEQIEAVYQQGFDDFAGPKQFRHASNYTDYHKAGLRAVRATLAPVAAQQAADAPLPNEPRPCRKCDPSVGYVCEEHGDDEADAYNHACELMEQHQRERAARGVEIGTEGSLCDGIAWLYDRLKKLEGEQQAAAKAPAAQAVDAVNQLQFDQVRAELRQLEHCMDACEPEDQKAFYNIRAFVIAAIHGAASTASTPEAAGDVELIRVPAHEADSYCRILSILGMEEEGDPVAEVQRLFDAEASQQAAAVAAPSEQQANVLPPFAAPAGQHDAKSWNAALVAAEKAIRERACGDEIFVDNAAEELVLLRRNDE